MGQTESEITSSIRRLLSGIGVMVWKQWQGPMSQPKGVSDLIGCWNGRFIAIEVKRPGGRLSVEQGRFLDRVKAAGGIAMVARSVDDVIDQLGIRGKFLF